MTTTLEVRMTIKTLARKGVPNQAIGRESRMSEGNAPLSPASDYVPRRVTASA
ncbi:MAG: hypothetical protein ACNS61_16565 [Candidatus Wenzhouxiangella sp. M2_3B_020]